MNNDKQLIDINFEIGRINETLTDIKSILEEQNESRDLVGLDRKLVHLESIDNSLSYILYGSIGILIALIISNFL